MATSFNGIAFGIITSDFRPLPFSQTLFQNPWHVPYSDINGVDLGGKSELRLTATIRVVYGVLTSYRAWLGQTYVLIVDDVNYGPATLLKVENIRYDPHAVYALFDAEFVIS